MCFCVGVCGCGRVRGCVCVCARAMALINLACAYVGRAEGSSMCSPITAAVQIHHDCFWFRLLHPPKAERDGEKPVIFTSLMELLCMLVDVCVCVGGAK